MAVPFALPWRVRAVIGAALAATAGLPIPASFAQTAAVPQPPGVAGDSATAPADTSQRTIGPEPDALIYSVARLPESVFQTGRAVSVVSGADLRRRGARTLPEALMEQAGVFVQQTAYGHGAPIIRGMIGKQILIMINGVRLNNATYRFGPNQYLGTIDLETVERVEIVRGVGSVLGSDALGGIINIVTRKGLPDGDRAALGGRVATRFSSADHSRSIHGEAFGRGSGFRFLAGTTHRRSGDVHAGGTGGPQVATGYRDDAANLYVERDLGTKTLSAAFQVMELHDVPRTDRVASGTHLRYVYDPQRAEVATFRFEDPTPHPWADQIQLTVFWNRQKEGRVEVFAGAPEVERQFIDVDILTGINAEAALFLGDHGLVYGAEYSREQIRSSGVNVHVSSGVRTPRRGVYTDGATYRTAAVFLQDRFEPSDLLTATLGLRYGGVSTGGSEVTNVGVLDLKGGMSALTGAAGLIIHAGDHVNVVGNATKGIRAPNLDDVSAFEVRAEGTEVPNAEARAERVHSYEIGVKYNHGPASGSLFYFTNDLSNLLVRTSGVYNGLGYIDSNDNGQRDAGEKNVLQKRNLGTARIRGLEARGRYLLIPSVSASGHATWTRGDDTGKDIPLGRIPPLFGLAAVRWDPVHSAGLWAELVYAFAGSQRRLSTEDIGDSRIGPGGTDAWRAVALRGGVAARRHLVVSAGLENIFDEKYKYHGSGVYRPGRQMVLNAQLSF